MTRILSCIAGRHAGNRFDRVAPILAEGKPIIRDWLIAYRRVMIWR